MTADAKPATIGGIRRFPSEAAMSPTAEQLSAEQLFQKVMTLPVKQRVQLAEAVLDASQTGEEFVIHPAWKEELERRSKLVDSGEMSTSPWSEVKERVRRHLEGKSDG